MLWIPMLAKKRKLFETRKKQPTENQKNNKYQNFS